MADKVLAIKIDVDTDRGTRIGVPNLLALFAELEIPVTFLFSLGPDNTGQAIKRIFRPGFLKKVSRSGVVSMYGIRTLLNGTLLPAPHIGRRNAETMRSAHKAGHEVGIHCYDHIRWQDHLMHMTEEQVTAEFAKARHEFNQVFGFAAKTAGAAGWQANTFSLEAYQQAHLLYASDTRGHCPFFPRSHGKTFSTLQIPTSLPTLDELIGDPAYPLATLTNFYCSQLRVGANTFTAHAEIEGMKYLAWFREFLTQAKQTGVQFIKGEELARQALAAPQNIPVCELVQGTIAGRSGHLAMQGGS